MWRWAPDCRSLEWAGVGVVRLLLLLHVWLTDRVVLEGALGGLCCCPTSTQGVLGSLWWRDAAAALASWVARGVRLGCRPRAGLWVREVRGGPEGGPKGNDFS